MTLLEIAHIEVTVQRARAEDDAPKEHQVDVFRVRLRVEIGETCSAPKCMEELLETLTHLVQELLGGRRGLAHHDIDMAEPLRE